MINRGVFGFLILSMLVPSARSQTSATVTPTDAQRNIKDHVRSNYTKFEFRIPMRDGARLFTAVYVPKNDSQPHPVLLNRTPYSVAPYGVDNYREKLGPSEFFQ
jgi:predicted acyl esterase